MSQEQQPKGITRRRLLRDVATGAFGLMIGSGISKLIGDAVSSKRVVAKSSPTPQPIPTETFTPTPTPTSTETPAPTPTPDTSRVEFTNTAEWEKNFVGLPVPEIRKLVAEAKAKGEIKFPLPLDPRETPVSIKPMQIPSPDVIANILSFNNIKKGSQFLTPADGYYTIQVAIGGSDIIRNIPIVMDGNDSVRVTCKPLENLGIKQDPTKIEIGTPLFTISDQLVIPSLYPQTQFYLLASKNGNLLPVTADNLLRSDGKLVFPIK